MKRTIVYFLLATAIIACGTDDGYSEYKKMLDKETASGKRVDSIFMGIYLGMTSKQFYAHCWEMNKKGIFTDGLNNSAVLYKIDSAEAGHPASMNFYPDFTDNKISKMRVSFQYDAWAPWNKHLSADSLLPQVLKLYKKWYKEGNPFVKVNDKQKGTVYVKVDGNRRITIGATDDMIVKVDFTDLTTEKKENKK
jgi:hypothetical protein